MSFTGIVENGKVVLPPEANLPSGTKVRVETVEPQTDSLADSLQEFIGVFDDLPTDLARNHDHYTDLIPILLRPELRPKRFERLDVKRDAWGGA